MKKTDIQILTWIVFVGTCPKISVFATGTNTPPVISDNSIFHWTEKNLMSNLLKYSA